MSEIPIHRRVEAPWNPTPYPFSTGGNSSPPVPDRVFTPLEKRDKLIEEAVYIFEQIAGVFPKGSIHRTRINQWIKEVNLLDARRDDDNT